MHTYKKINGDMTHDDKWHVGYYTMEADYNAYKVTAGGGVWFTPGGGPPPSPPVVSTWKQLSEHDSERAAMNRVHYLNGGRYESG